MKVRQTAAKLRVCHLEAAASGGLRVASRAAALRRAQVDADNILVRAHWADWFERSFVLQLEAAMETCRAQGVTAAAVERRILCADADGRIERPLLLSQARLLKRSFQRVAGAMLPRPRAVDLEPRIRHKLDRQVGLWPRVRVARCVAFLSAVRNTVPPRVWAAVWRSLWNGWATSRRTQGRHGLPGCMFSCSPDAPDSVEHYAHCPRLHAVAGRLLGLPRPETPAARLAAFLGLDARASKPAGHAVRVAIRLCAAYRTHCLCRHGQVRRGPAAEEALRQSCREAVRGSAAAAAAYDAAVDWRWAQGS